MPLFLCVFNWLTSARDRLRRLNSIELKCNLPLERIFSSLPAIEAITGDYSIAALLSSSHKKVFNCLPSLSIFHCVFTLKSAHSGHQCIILFLVIATKSNFPDNLLIDDAFVCCSSITEHCLQVCLSSVCDTRQHFSSYL